MEADGRIGPTTHALPTTGGIRVDRFFPAQISIMSALALKGWPMSGFALT